MPKTEMLHIRVEPEIKQMADQTFRSLGLTTADAVNVFLRKSIDAVGFPFAVRRRYNKETLEALAEAERIAHDPNAKTYEDFSEILKEIDDEIAAEENAHG